MNFNGKNVYLIHVRNVEGWNPSQHTLISKQDKNLYRGVPPSGHIRHQTNLFFLLPISALGETKFVMKSMTAIFKRTNVIVWR